MNKSNTLLFGVLLFSTFCFSQIVNIPDQNFKNALLLDLEINTNGDGEIQVVEAEATTDIQVNGFNISDLTGIEAFVNITFLDVTNNPMLTLLSMGNNIISQLDVSNNPSSDFITVESSQPFEKIMIFNIQGTRIITYPST